MINKDIREICEYLSALEEINKTDFYLLYKKFYICLIGALRTKDYRDRKNTILLGNALLSIKVININQKEAEDIKKKKEEMVNSLYNLNAKTR